MGSGLTSPTHIIFILVLAILLFGAKRLPEVGRSLGTGMREFKESISGAGEPEAEPVREVAPVNVTPVA